MKLIFEEKRKFGYGLEEEIAKAIGNIGEDTIRECEEFLRKYYPNTTIYIHIPLDIEEKGGEFYLIITNIDDEKWIEWQTIYTDKRAYDHNIINDRIATLVMD